jgi:hypothetical protein
LFLGTREYVLQAEHAILCKNIKIRLLKILKRLGFGKKTVFLCTMRNTLRLGGGLKHREQRGNIVKTLCISTDNFAARIQKNDKKILLSATRFQLAKVFFFI